MTFKKKYQQRLLVFSVGGKSTIDVKWVSGKDNFGINTFRNSGYKTVFYKIVFHPHFCVPVTRKDLCIFRKGTNTQMNTDIGPVRYIAFPPYDS